MSSAENTEYGETRETGRKILPPRHRQVYYGWISRRDSQLKNTQDSKFKKQKSMRVRSIVDKYRRCQRCKRCSMYDDTANAFWGTYDRRRQCSVLCLGKENRRDSVTHLHIYGISIFVGGPWRPVNGEIIHIFVVGETYPRVVRVKATRNCTAARANRSTRTTSRRGKRSKLKVTSLVVGQIFNFSTGRCARHTAEVRATLKFARKVARTSLRRRSFPDVKRLKRILTSERRATRCASIKK